jgi:hypothetical protein
MHMESFQYVIIYIIDIIDISITWLNLHIRDIL